MSSTKNVIKFTLISICLIILTCIDLKTGHIDIPFKEIIKFLTFGEVSNEYHLLIKEFRFPRVFVAILAGASLSVSGLLMQTSFRNPLAGPYVLGISSGASFGVAIIVLGSGFFAKYGIDINSHYSLLTFSGIGAAIVLLIILAVSLRLKDSLSILIIGILIAGVVSSIVGILQYYAKDINVKSFVLWTMGSLNAVTYKNIVVLFPIILVSIISVFALSKNLNLMLPGESFAKSMGVNVKINRILIYTFVSILTGAVTAFCGPLGFIGVAVPHIARWIFNSSNHFILIPASILLGSIFMICSDLLTIIIPQQGILPINAITAIMGAPFIIWIVVRNKRTIV